MSHIDNILLEEAVVSWLQGWNVSVEDVLLDKRGYYIINLNEAGIVGDDGYSFREEKIYLPVKFQNMSLRD